MPLGSVLHTADLQPEPLGTLVGQGFIPPEFDLSKLKDTVGQLAGNAQQAEDAAEHAEEALVTAGGSAEQAARYADRAFRLPMAEPGTEAMGEDEGFAPNRAKWGSLSSEPLVPLAIVRPPQLYDSSQGTALRSLQHRWQRPGSFL
eukprot:TRINITY_DN108153_c0_g1_i1.p2 TRINITY_DN108153_c0_g1~~TRINITY_DN108153_c0_g1_i1.p2  ORF type:complete len:146 (-),score=35.83 TRINITY_DN108153_c0_g1_i1:43-480(-)